MILQVHKDLELTTGIKSEKLWEISQLVSSMMRMPVQANKAIVGKNAFAHSSGIHQDGFLKHAENYEIMNPADVGVNSSSIILTARSGRAAIKHRLELLGFSVGAGDWDLVYENFLQMADRKKSIDNGDLQQLMANLPVLK
jgi:2-isopropylmalate synthase